jgi:hypothetical protein
MTLLLRQICREITNKIPASPTMKQPTPYYYVFTTFGDNVRIKVLFQLNCLLLLYNKFVCRPLQETHLLETKTSGEEKLGNFI